MSSRNGRCDPNRPPVHPGELLREDVLQALRRPIWIARDLRVARQLLHRILAEKAPVTPAMALRLGKFCGNGPDLRLRMQQAYDLWHSQKALQKELNKILAANEAA